MAHGLCAGQIDSLEIVGMIVENIKYLHSLCEENKYRSIFELQPNSHPFLQSILHPMLVSVMVVDR